MCGRKVGWSWMVGVLGFYVEGFVDFVGEGVVGEWFF